VLIYFPEHHPHHDILFQPKKCSNQFVEEVEIWLKNICNSHLTIAYSPATPTSSQGQFAVNKGVSDFTSAASPALGVVVRQLSVYMTGCQIVPRLAK